MGGIVRVEARNLAEFRRQLKALDRALGKDLRQVYLRVSRLVAGVARGAAPGRLAPSIQARATQRKASVVLKPGKRGDELLRFAGTKRRTGWYARRRYARSTRQHPRWIGNQWEPGTSGGAPYFIGEPINASVPAVIRELGDGVEELARRAFPD